MNIKINNKDYELDMGGGTDTSAFNDLLNYMSNKENSIPETNIAYHFDTSNRREPWASCITSKIKETKLSKREKYVDLMEKMSDRKKETKKEKVSKLIDEILSLISGQSSMLRERTRIDLYKIKNNLDYQDLDKREKELLELKQSIKQDKKQEAEEVDLSYSIKAFKSLL